MLEPLHYRKEIPFFYNKSEKEFQQDPYERFDPMVLRQSALHLADELWGGYPFDKISKFLEGIHLGAANDIVEIGCGVGRWISDVAKKYPNAQYWGIDYSYQMLKRAREIWIQGDEIQLDLSRYGFSSMYKIQHKPLGNLQFGLAKAEALPFDDASQDVVLSSFLLDRLEDPGEGIREIRRVLRPGGRMVLVSPLNFSQGKHWEQYYPPIKIFKMLIGLGFKILDWEEKMVLEEPLDCHGNMVQWQCIGMIVQWDDYSMD